jgi:hypothetical protein
MTPTKRKAMYGLDLDADGNLLRVSTIDGKKTATKSHQPHPKHPLTVPKSILFFKGDCWYSGGIWRCF